MSPADPSDLLPDEPDLAVAAYRDHGRWEVDELTAHHLVDVETLVAALRRLPGDDAVLAMVAQGDDFLLVRVTPDGARLLLSDVVAADEWDLADDLLDHLGDDVSDGEDDDGWYVPPGDLEILADLGVSADDLLDVVNDDDEDLDVVDLLADLADQLGFGEQFEDAVGLTPA